MKVSYAGQYRYVRPESSFFVIKQEWQYWLQSLYYMKNYSNKILPSVSIEPLAQDSKSSMLPLP